MFFKCASSFAMYGAMWTRSVAPCTQILNFSLMDERENPQWRAAAVPDLERRGDDHGAGGRQLVEVGEALQAVTAGTMHVVMARVGRAQVIGLAGVRTDRLGAEAEDVALGDEELHRFDVGSRRVLSFLVVVLIGHGIVALGPVGAHQYPRSGRDAPVLLFPFENER